MADAPNFRVWLAAAMTKDVVLVSAPDQEAAREKALELRPDHRVVHVAPYPAEGE